MVFLLGPGYIRTSWLFVIAPMAMAAASTVIMVHHCAPPSHASCLVEVWCRLAWCGLKRPEERVLAGAAMRGRHEGGDSPHFLQLRLCGSRLQVECPRRSKDTV